MEINLIDEIRLDNEWRTKDIAKMKMTYSQLPEANRGFFLRLCVPMIYAHWEGLVVSSLTSLIKGLNKSKLSHSNVPVKLFVLSVGEKFKRLQSNQSLEQRCDFTQTFFDRLNNHLTFEKKVNTKSNLNYKVLGELCNMFLLDIEDFSIYENDIDKLVDIRNKIAHGENAYLFELPQIEKYFELLENICEVFLNNIEKFINQKRYEEPITNTA
ncbi:MAG: hypothetical protein H6572_06875 [Lewinellaceae bacterium]|nr:hypothetical protein [Lewinellaceae bacterium]